MDATQSREDEQVPESSGGQELAGRGVLAEAQSFGLGRAKTDKQKHYDRRKRRAIYLSGRET